MTSEAALLEQIYAAPDDDAPRLIYADWLQERGDPRGEFIALQIERARGKARSGGRQREDELLAEHREQWAAPIGATGEPPDSDYWAQAIHPKVAFGRGFPETVETAEVWFDPAWSTVRSCNVPPIDDRCHATSLRTVTGARNRDIVGLAKLSKPLAIESLAWGPVQEPKHATGLATAKITATPHHIAAFRDIAVLPRLRRLELSTHVFGAAPQAAEHRWVWTRPLAELRVPGLTRELANWHPLLADSQLERFDLDAGSLSGSGWQACMRIRLERDTSFQAIIAVIYRGTNLMLDQLQDGIPRLAKGAVTSARIAIAVKSDFERLVAERDRLAQMFERCRIAATIVKASS